MRTTLTLDDEVAEMLRLEVRRSGKSFKEVVNEAVRDSLARRKKMAKLPRYVVKAYPMGTYPGIDYSKTAEMLEIADARERK